MDKQKVKFMYSFLFILFIIWLIIWFNYENWINSNWNNIDNNKEIKQSNIDNNKKVKQNNIDNNKKVKQNNIQYYIESIKNSNSGIIDIFNDITWTWEIQELKNYIDNSNYIKIDESVKNIISKIPDNSKLDDSKKAKKVALEYIDLWAILNNANYYYREKESQKEVEKILNEIKQVDPELFDNFYWNYYLWYSKEIIKEYDKALEYYNKAMNYSTEDNKITSSIILNQIWHVYDLKWELNKAYEYYFKAYNLYKWNYASSINIARYLTRIWDLEKAKQFLIYSLETKNNNLKSEIYFSLSTLELELNWLNPNIDKSIEYAKLSIKSFPDYPMWYLALARGYYMLNDSKYDNEIEENLSKSIKLNSDWNEAYKYYAYYYLDKNNIEKAIEYIGNSNQVIDKDMILMEDQKDNLKKVNVMLVQIFIFINRINNEWVQKNANLVNLILNNKYYDSFINLQKKRTNNWILNIILK